jgi:tripartite-type tricarboxylate transporter receptor subunit TctC
VIKANLQRRKTLRFGSSMFCLALTPHSGVAQSAWPSRPIRWIVPFLPGTAPDITVRIVAEGLTAKLGQPIVVENKAGAAGSIGARQVAKSAPDGYTWLYSSTTLAASTQMYKAPGYDALKDFEHISRLAVSDVTILVHPESGLRSTKQLIERMQQAPGQLNYGSGGVGTPAHLGAELLLYTTQSKATHIPFKGAVESVNALIGRQIDFTFAISQVGLPHVKSGRLVALAVTGSQRNGQLPNIPTLQEQGWPDLVLVSFGGVSVPAGTSAEIRQKIFLAVHETLSMTTVREKLVASGSLPAASSSDEFIDQLRREVNQTSRMMKIAKLEPQ